METANPNYCPHCGVSLQGKRIPVQDQAYYNGKRHYSRVVSVYSREKDMTTSWKCPDCGHKWPR
jgi:predicted RNA-binding Zn-ribbon protein involved in translation (DUF1610 family)